MSKEKGGGSLTTVGIGIRAPAQTTLEASSQIEHAEKVFSLCADPLAEYWIRSLNASTESLSYLYAVGKERRETYREMVEQIMGAVRENVRVCAVAYGHPGVAAYPLHEAVRRARAEGFHAEMFAGVSAEDCLFAELGVDPVSQGCRSYEATDFLLHPRGADPTSHLILWQIGAIAITAFKPEVAVWNPKGVAILAETLLEDYPPDHEVVIYEAAQLPLCDSMIERAALKKLPQARMTPMSTLFVPAIRRAPVDETMRTRLEFDRSTEASAARSD